MFTSNDTILLLVAHPDDETIGFGGHISQCPKLHIVYLTEGSPEDLKYARNCGCNSMKEYAELRKNELERALAVCGFNYNNYYNLKSIDLGVVYSLEKVIREALALILTIQPTVFLTHPYEGGHPDHDCAAYIGQKCAEILLKNRVMSTIRRFEFTCYHGKNGYLETGTFLNHSENITAIQLSLENKQIKENMLKCYHSQKEMLSLFCTCKETFRPAPVYSFINPPHDGQLLYERMNMGIEGQYWRNIVNSASTSFKL
jgi:LmbE family N-acetylglucosaminyl deacetylase